MVASEPVPEELLTVPWAGGACDPVPVGLSGPVGSFVLFGCWSGTGDGAGEGVTVVPQLSDPLAGAGLAGAGDAALPPPVAVVAEPPPEIDVALPPEFDASGVAHAVGMDPAEGWTMVLVVLGDR